MALCMEPRSEPHGHGIMANGYPGYPHYDNVFDGDFYKCLCEDLAKELDFPDQTDLRKISQLQLFGSSWETDPYKKLLIRCLDHSLPKMRVEPMTPRTRGASIDDDATGIMVGSDDFALEASSVPINPPPSPALCPVGYPSSSTGRDVSSLLDIDSGMFIDGPLDENMLSMQGVEQTGWKRPPLSSQSHLPSPPDSGDEGDDRGDGDDDNDAHIYYGLSASEIAEARRLRRQQQQLQQQQLSVHYHRRIASTGLLATVVAGDGSIMWHFKEFS
ncbi:hypothetical protein Dda_9454 [Drechslerella dactyloides]|uniref:Uncharacterized protein n=1 Tax=Drechslerella dactyloides TaxID=74499 RepID=A0AAD6IQA6_DREDA|nr:hypothetical protein Dda_9454 [Drechslerella dactyloides]